MSYEAIVIGVSSGGMNALRLFFSQLPQKFNIPIVIVQHMGAHSTNYWIKILNESSPIIIKEADEKEAITKGYAYVAPANYHLLIEKNKTFTLTIDEKVNFARPSIDVLFESAAEAYKNKLIGIVLTGANNDGAAGLKKIKQYGGLSIVQNPEDAEASYMPEKAIETAAPDHILNLKNITALLTNIDKHTHDESIH
jgi:two-component system, chemotaxis family, protein-glutamate methylesterase/glutaminase